MQTILTAAWAESVELGGRYQLSCNRLSERQQKIQSQADKRSVLEFDVGRLCSTFDAHRNEIRLDVLLHKSKGQPTIILCPSCRATELLQVALLLLDNLAFDPTGKQQQATRNDSCSQRPALTQSQAHVMILQCAAMRSYLRSNDIRTVKGTAS